MTLNSLPTNVACVSRPNHVTLRSLCNSILKVERLGKMWCRSVWIQPKILFGHCWLFFHFLKNWRSHLYDRKCCDPLFEAPFCSMTNRPHPNEKGMLMMFVHGTSAWTRVYIYVCDVLCAFERNCDLMLSSCRCSRRVRIVTCSVYSLIQAITKLTRSMLFLSPGIVSWLQTVLNWCDNNIVFIFDVLRFYVFLWR